MQRYTLNTSFSNKNVPVIHVALNTLCKTN